VVHRVGVVIVLLCVLLSWREAEAQVGQNTEYLKDNKDFDNVGIVLSVSQLHDNFIGWDKVLPTYAGHGEGDFAITASCGLRPGVAGVRLDVIGCAMYFINDGTKRQTVDRSWFALVDDEGERWDSTDPATMPAADAAAALTTTTVPPEQQIEKFLQFTGIYDGLAFPLRIEIMNDDWGAPIILLIDKPLETF
jgi:hypothetical protein